MRHQKAKLQFNRFTSWRKATLRSMLRNLIVHQSMKTTWTKAKALKPLMDKLITSAKADTLSARRHAFDILQDHKLVNLLFTDIVPRFKDKNSGFTRLINFGARRGDNASMAVLEFTEIKKKEVHKSKKAKEEKPASQEVIDTTSTQEDKPVAEPKAKEPHPVDKKPSKKFLGGIKGIFKKERDAL